MHKSAKHWFNIQSSIDGKDTGYAGFFLSISICSAPLCLHNSIQIEFWFHEKIQRYTIKRFIIADELRTFYDEPYNWTDSERHT